MKYGNVYIPWEQIETQILKPGEITTYSVDNAFEVHLVTHLRFMAYLCVNIKPRRKDEALHFNACQSDFIYLSFYMNTNPLSLLL